MPVGQKIKMYYDPRGQVIRTVNPDLSEQRVVYGVPISLDTPGSFTPTPWETYTYDANDLADEWEGTGDSHVNSSHHYTPKSAEVDALGRTVKTMDRLESSNDTGNNVVMKYAYDIRGNLLEVKDAYDNIVFEHVYDLRTPAKEGESIPPLKTTHINKGTSTIVFDCVGKTVETRDAKGALTLLAYDTMQRPVDVWCRDNSSESVVLRQHVEYGTSAGDNSKGKLWKQYDEAGYQQINTYDFKGNVLEKYRQVILDSEILGTISTWSGTAWTTNPGPCYRVDWANPGSINTALLDTRQYQTNMQYDGLNRIKEITYPEDASSSRKILTPTYSKAGALRKITFDSTDYVKEIAYNAKGQRLLIAYGNHIMTRYVYDENTFRLLRLKTEKYTYSQTGDEHLYEYDSGTTKQDFAYLYDLSGNIVSINDETPESAAGGGDGLEKLFEYDALYRLLNATGRENQPTNMFWDDAYRSDDPRNTESYSQAYTYDLMGNIAELAHTANNSSNNFTREFSYGGNLLNSIAVGGNTYNFYYDTCGNMIQENSERFFEWDYADRMRLFYNQAGGGTEPSVISHYLYDAGGNRVKKLTRVSGGNWESITYIDGLIEYREDNVTNRGSISHVMDDTRRVATVRNGHAFGDSTPDVKYNLDDHLGSSGVLLDTSGTLVSREEYYPFGETSFGSYGKKRYRFCGKEKDEESGLYYYGARYYSPWTCRFVSVDPLAGKFPFYTPYQYSGNHPINFVDLDGKEKAKPPLKEKKKVPMSADSFMKEFKKWEKLVEPAPSTTVYETDDLGISMAVETGNESPVAAQLRVFVHDYTAPSKDQIIKDLKYQATFGSHVNVGGFPLDVKHFFKNVALSRTVGEGVAEQAGINEEIWQSINWWETDGTKSSAFSPEDLMSNKLGQIFSRFATGANISDNLSGFLKEASELFATNDVKNGKIFTPTLIKELRAFLKQHYGTTDFKELQSGGSLWKPEFKESKVKEATGSLWNKTKGYFQGIVSGSIFNKPVQTPAK